MEDATIATRGRTPARSPHPPGLKAPRGRGKSHPPPPPEDAPVSILQKPDFTLVADEPRFDAAIEHVLDAAFGPGRFAKVSERVREFATLDRGLSRIALRGQEVSGCCRIHRIAIGATPALFLGPLAVSPVAQGAGLGQALVGATLEACERSGVGAVIVVGQPRMFAPFGFTEIPKEQILMPGPVEARRFQWRALRNGGLDALAGAVRAPRAAS
jgi:predicted N-acetyltransferase YhbS